MLQQLTIKNYALIEELSINFSEGLSIITGETGAGKSILLGALGLVLGNRADLNSLSNKEKKCVVEAHINITNYHLKYLFEQLDIDFETITILRREILPSGKSRAFVNDTPVTLSILNQLKEKLIDIHSQHQTLEVSQSAFQFQLIDALAKNDDLVSNYKENLEKYQSAEKELQDLVAQQREANQQFDYNSHLFNELEEASLVNGEQEELEEKLEKLNNIESIKESLSESLQIAVDDNIGLASLLQSLENNLRNISTFSKSYQELYERISSVSIEINDIIVELENENENVDFNPNEIESLNDRLQLIYNLQKKHYVNSIEELQKIHEELSEKVGQVENAEEAISNKEKEVKILENKLNTIAAQLTKERKSVLPKLTNSLEAILKELGMPQGKFSIDIAPAKTFLRNGKDEISFLFSANKGGSFGELKKVASGGELSRIMLAIKKVLSENSQLPTIIFDEIDTGVSGEISNKMAKIMQEMSRGMQVITITHLPQIAAKGNQHYKVYKNDVQGKTQTQLKQLSNDERIVEIAEMLSGKNLSDSAISHAKELLN